MQSGFSLLTCLNATFTLLPRPPSPRRFYRVADVAAAPWNRRKDLRVQARAFAGRSATVDQSASASMRENGVLFS
jgi:hypothetical protein